MPGPARSGGDLSNRVETYFSGGGKQTNRTWVGKITINEAPEHRGSDLETMTILQVLSGSEDKRTGVDLTQERYEYNRDVLNDGNPPDEGPGGDRIKPEVFINAVTNPDDSRLVDVYNQRAGRHDLGTFRKGVPFTLALYTNTDGTAADIYAAQRPDATDFADGSADSEQGWVRTLEQKYLFPDFVTAGRVFRWGIYNHAEDPPDRFLGLPREWGVRS